MDSCDFCQKETSLIGCGDYYLCAACLDFIQTELEWTEGTLLLNPVEDLSRENDEGEE